MRTTTLGIFLTILSVLAIGCGDGSNPSSELDGIWTKSCAAGESQTLVISAGTYSDTGIVGGDANCGGGLTVTIIGELELGAAVTEPVGAKALDIAYTTINIAPNTHNVAAALNAQARCGFTDWTVGVAKNVLGMTCGSTTFHEHDFSIYKLDGNQLQVGKDDGVNNGETAATRERVLADPFTLQN